MAEGDIIIMKQSELKRLYVVKQIQDKKLKQIAAANMLGLSRRQIRRIVSKFRSEGERGLTHKSRGKPSNRKLPDKIKEKTVKLYKAKYKDFGPTLATEKLFEINNIKIGTQTLRNWLIESGDWHKKRKLRKHYYWRERKHHKGEMIQMDGSHHRWFEDRAKECVLMGYIDDATNAVYARFYEYEGVIPAMDSFKGYLRQYGIPHSIYFDKHPTYKSNAKATIEYQLKGLRPESHFERALRELGVKTIHAHSPQAKGRIERLFKTFQDRLVKEMRLKGIKTIKEANRFLQGYLLDHNRRFGIKPINKVNLHRPLPKTADLNSILALKTKRALRNDFTVAHDKKLYQIISRINAKKVTVEERINGVIYITHKDKKLEYKEIALNPIKKKLIIKPRKINRPAMDHPLKKALYDRRIVLLKSKNMAKELALSGV